MTGMSEQTQKITYKWLKGEELAAVESTIAERGWMSLNPATSRVVAAEENSKLIGFFVFQVVPHTGPIYVNEAYRGHGVAERMTEMMIEFLRSVNCRGFIALPENKHSEALCKSYGLVKLDYPVYMSIGVPE